MTKITPSLPFLRPALMSLLTACASFPHTGLAAKAPGPVATVTAAKPSSEVIPESVFDYRGGKDPFFPNRIMTPALTPDSTKKEIMVLKGITGTPDRRVALINDRTFTKGETGEIKSGTNTLTIRVVEIKDRSVTIEYAGQTNELALVENVLRLDGRK
jgi:hypothetical protein